MILIFSLYYCPAYIYELLLMLLIACGAPHVNAENVRIIESSYSSWERVYIYFLHSVRIAIEETVYDLLYWICKTMLRIGLVL